MKKLLMLTAFMCSVMLSPVVHAGWTQVAWAKNGGGLYADLERIRKHNGKIYVWTLSNYLKPTKHGVLSSKVYEEVECGRFRYRPLSSTFFRGSMGEGSVVTTVGEQTEWNYPPPKSVMEGALTVICNHKP